MSWKCSVRYRACGPFSWHVYIHALDPKQRRFYAVGVGHRTYQVWPPRSVLNPENEWTLQTDADLLRLIAWAQRRLIAEQRLRDGT